MNKVHKDEDQHSQEIETAVLAAIAIIESGIDRLSEGQIDLDEINGKLAHINAQLDKLMRHLGVEVG